MTLIFNIFSYLWGPVSIVLDIRVEDLGFNPCLGHEYLICLKIILKIEWSRIVIRYKPSNFVYYLNINVSEAEV